MTELTSLQDARQKINELIEAAETGALIPIRLPRQLTEIRDLIDAVEQEQNELITQAQKATLPADAQQVTDENAIFLKTAIHELRTPMTSIRGYSDMLGNVGMVGELTDMQSQLLAVIRSNSKRMESLLSDMSTINKLRGDILAVSEKMDMFKNIAMMVEKKMMPVAEELGRRLEFDIPQGLPLLNTDGELMALAINKLIENSLRYTQADDPYVKVSGETDGSTLVVKIEDNGIGITPEEQTHLGELYFRSDNDVVRGYKGSGLGIPIAFGIMDKLKGEYSFESAPERGTTFTLRFKGMT